MELDLPRDEDAALEAGAHDRADILRAQQRHERERRAALEVDRVVGRRAVERPLWVKPRHADRAAEQLRVVVVVVVFPVVIVVAVEGVGGVGGTLLAAAY